MDNRIDRRNHYFFGLGTVGRDMFYTMVSMYLMVYITEALNVSNQTLAIITSVMLVLRVFDAFNDPIMGLVVDNTHSRFGKFKPWILVGAILGGIFMLGMFFDFGLTGWACAAVMGGFYLLWDVFYGLNDIAYWSMMPALTTDQKQREKIGSFARICADVGLFAVVVAIIPAKNALIELTGSNTKGWFVLAAIIVVLMLGFQLFTLFGVKERRDYFKQEEKTTLRQMFGVILKNDQLLWVAISMSLFMIGYCTTTSFGVHYFKYAYGDENMYTAFSAVLGISQLTALSVFTLVRKLLSRRKLYTLAISLVVAGYLIFFFAPANMLYIGVAGVLIFVGEAFIQMITLMALSDTIEYGQLKLGKRNESVTFSVQPFINKIGGAIASGVMGFTLIVTGINEAASPADVLPQGIMQLKLAMLILPLVAIVAGYIIYMAKYRIDENRYAQILAELKARGDIAAEGAEADAASQTQA